MDDICGILDYCYDGVPVLRGYVSHKILNKYSTPHSAYQRKSNDEHVRDIERFISGGNLTFMPEIILSYNYSGVDTHGSDGIEELKDPIEQLYNATHVMDFEDSNYGIKLRGFKGKRRNTSFEDTDQYRIAVLQDK